MLELDGSAGGGQLVRTALSLSALTDTPFRMEGIRGGRPEPGLTAQHLAAVELLAAVVDADVEGASQGSESMTFEPGDAEAGRYAVDIGTAGSVVLLFDAVLPLAAVLKAPLVVEATGGTDVRWAPTADHYRHVKLPLLRGHGVGVALDLDRRGFYPAGGGRATLWLGPSSLGRFELGARRSSADARVFSVASSNLTDREVAERQAMAAVDGLDEIGLDVHGRTVEYTRTRSTGSAVAVCLGDARARAGFDSLGERGTRAEAVAEDAVERARAYVESSAAVDAHTADQLVVFVALAGGRVAIPSVTEHVETNVALLERFGQDVRIDRSGTVPALVADGAGST